jgi:alkylmercury lyase
MIRMLRLLAEGKPLGGPQVDAAITDLGISRDEARAQLDAWTERTDDGDIVGLGFTYNPTLHRVIVEDANMWAWCAMDTLIFAIVLDRPLMVESTPPGTGETVRLQASPAGCERSAADQRSDPVAQARKRAG